MAKGRNDQQPKQKQVRHSTVPVIGERFGQITVLGSHKSPQGNTVWDCQCDCGELVNRQPSNLRSGKYLSCQRCSGPVHKRLGITVGKKFGWLTIMDRVAEIGKTTKWLCACDCGGTAVLSAYHINQVETPGCKACEGQRKAEAKVVHGEFIGMVRGSKTRLWRTWASMNERCDQSLGPTQGWTVYRRKRIAVCPEWHDFIVFRDWALSHGYADDLTIERKEPYDNYTPENCEWITRSENSRRAVTRLTARRNWEAPMRPWDEPHFPIEMMLGSP